MTDFDRRRGRRQRERVDGGRRHSYRVTVSAEEAAVLVRVAAEQRVTVSRVLMEAALSGDGVTHSQRLEVVVELFELRGLLGAIGLGLRELVASGLVGESMLDAARELILRTGEVAGRLDATAEVLAAR